MTQEKKMPPRRHQWYKIQESSGQGHRKITWNITLDNLQCGINFSDLRSEMDRIEATYGQEFEAFRIEPENEYGYGDAHPHQVYYVEGLRWETDEEYQTRLTKAQDLEKARLEQRRKEYERLAKEFGDKNDSVTE